MRAHLKPTGLWVTTVETGMVTQGVPDFNYIAKDGTEGWCECKATKGWAVVFKPMQVGWHERRARYGGRSWIAVRRATLAGPRSGAAVDELYLVPGCHVIELRDEGLNCGRALFMGDGGPSRWRWRDVYRLLTGPIVRG
jgi:hypothetical protein